MKQKRMAVISDMTGFGRCSIAVSLPIISALKCQCCPLPTAILSNHTGFSEFFFDDYTEKMPEYILGWKGLHLEFDGILTGFLGSEAQIDIVCDFIESFKKSNTSVIVDPVMGDNGKLYSTYTQNLAKKMKHLAAMGDIVLPNLTEACILTDTPYVPEKFSTKLYLDMCENIALGQNKKVVITGIETKDTISNFVYENGEYHYVKTKKAGKRRSGTGDVFSSVVAGKYIMGETLIKSVETAANFVKKSLKFSEELNIPTNQGVCFEEFLTTLK